MGANLRVRRRAKVFREEIESETKERHLTRPSNVSGTGWKLKEEGRSAVPEGHLTCPQTPFFSPSALIKGGQAWGQVKYRCPGTRRRWVMMIWGTSMGTGQISMPGNMAQMGYDYLGQMTSRKVTLTATPFRPNRSLFPMTVASAKEEGQVR
jgi:hypothetical protein